MDIQEEATFWEKLGLTVFESFWTVIAFFFFLICLIFYTMDVVVGIKELPWYTSSIVVAAAMIFTYSVAAFCSKAVDGIKSRIYERKYEREKL